VGALERSGDLSSLSNTSSRTLLGKPRRSGWTRLRAVVPDRTGILILDGTSFPKQGPASVGVARQHCGARGKIANCQTAVTVALWTGARAWLLGATLYLPETWLTPRQRSRGKADTVTFAAKWQLALTLLRQVRAAGFTVTGWWATPSSATTQRSAAPCTGRSCPMRWGYRPISRYFWGRRSSKRRRP
jgi:SRSO17 transposase